ncbi:DUF55-domain-containing protein [Trichodelitschia bisporula]|uniref:Thymocyte nuclear protein 1 n=1 Tax=Trichodelitschia bisporula TaxID=703511 RepID=A0A6G1HWW6_9PEZI|nr:DUF55-domain-containing protein [Trichodelitschia bisporula]
MPPRKRAAAADAEAPPTKQQKKTSTPAPSQRITRQSVRSGGTATPAVEAVTEGKATKAKRAPAPRKVTPAPSKAKKSKESRTSPPSNAAPASAAAGDPERQPGERRYWLMKAEPNSRIEKGIDVKFSIDDLAAKTEPETWDGIRNHVAKNNLLAMKKGDLAFFYHSNCKVPGVVGIMEIVGEAQVDETAWDPKSPYYDPKCSSDKPKWFCPLVEFRKKFNTIVTLETLKKECQPGTPLANIQLLKLSRLSVSKVSRDEWDHIIKLAEQQEAAGE